MSQDNKELTYGETIKQPFPKLEDIEWVMVEAPEWYPIKAGGSLNINADIRYSDQRYDNAFYKACRSLHENSKDFKVTWQLKQTDPYADIKAEYEKAKEKYDVVKVFWKQPNQGVNSWNKVNETETFNDEINDIQYMLRCYNIDWNKLLSWSYANGEFVECEFSSYSNFELLTFGTLKGITNISKYIKCCSVFTEVSDYCRLAKGVEIKDEWLTEVHNGSI